MFFIIIFGLGSLFVSGQIPQNTPQPVRRMPDSPLPAVSLPAGKNFVEVAARGVGQMDDHSCQRQRLACFAVYSRLGRVRNNFLQRTGGGSSFSPKITGTINLTARTARAADRFSSGRALNRK